MKVNRYIKYSSVVMALGLVLVSCDVLDVNPSDKITESQAFKNKAGIEKGILGSYSELQSLSYYGRAFLITADLAADNLAHPTDATSSDYAEIDNNSLLPENGVVEGLWNSMYSSINVANTVIDKVPSIKDMTDDEKAAALGELRFLRALSHFNLMNYFGAVPVKTQPTVGTASVNVARNSTDEVYAQVIADLTYAKEHLAASSSTKIRATKYAAAALLSRVYLYKKDYANAYKESNDVILHGGYTFLTDFSAVFSTESNAETIFEVEFDELDRNRIAEFNFPKTLNGRGEVKPDDNLIAGFGTTDKRLSVSVAYDDDQKTNVYAHKYTDLSLGDQNVIVLRLAEMYLTRAESQAHLSNPVVADIQSDINKTRNRAGLDNTSATTVSALLADIQNERRLEFAFEGHRWFDLIRTATATELLPHVTNTNQLLFPIPASEVNSNSLMTQNPGY